MASPPNPLLPKPVAMIAQAALFVFVLAPACFMVAKAFVVDGTISLEAARAIVLDQRQRDLFTTSVLLALGTAVAATIIGTRIALIAARTDLPGGRSLQLAALLPLLIPPPIQAIAWRDLLPFPGFYGAMFTLTLALFPFVTLLVASGLAGVDRRLEEAGRLHRSSVMVLLRVTLPLVRPHVMAGGILVFVFAVSNYGVPAVWEVNTYPIEIFVQFSSFYDEAAAAALSLPLFALTVGLLSFHKQIMGNRSYVTIAAGQASPLRLSLGSLKGTTVVSAWIVVVIAVVVPLGVLVVRSRSPAAYAQALASAAEPLLVSFGLAAAGATATVALCLPVACVIERSRTAVGRVTDYASVLPFAVPATTLGIGLIGVWNWPTNVSPYGTALMLLLGYVALCSPFAVRVLSSGIRQIGAPLEEAALLHSRGWLRRMVWIVVPLAAPAIAVAWSVAFVLSLADLGVTLLVIPPGWETLSLRIYNLMHYGANDVLSALCIILVALSTLPPLLTIWLLSYGRKSLNGPRRSLTGNEIGRS